MKVFGVSLKLMALRGVACIVVSIALSCLTLLPLVLVVMLVSRVSPTIATLCGMMVYLPLYVLIAGLSASIACSWFK